MKLSSSTFEEGGKIPSKYTCQGANLSPPLSITQIPAEAKSLVLIMEDPDVPPSIRADRMYDHWVVYDIDPHAHEIPEGATPAGILGKNTQGQNKYIGPCPPDGEHRYFFKLYALKKKLHLPPGSTKKEVEQAMQGAILDQCQLMGRYKKH